MHKQTSLASFQGFVHSFVKHLITVEALITRGLTCIHSRLEYIQGRMASRHVEWT